MLWRRKRAANWPVWKNASSPSSTRINNVTMNIKSTSKVIAAGFRIIRCEDFPTVRIKERTGRSHAWCTLESFTTKAARDRRFKELLQEPKIIED